MGGCMKEQIYVLKRRQMEAVKENYTEILLKESYTGMEIIAIQGFLEHMTSLYDDLLEELSENYKNNLDSIEEGFVQDNSCVAIKYKSLISQSEERADKEIENRKRECKDTINQINLEYEKENTKEESVFEAKLKEILKNKSEATSTYSEVSSPSNIRFYKKINRNAYEKKYSEFSKMYRSMIEQFDNEETVIRKKHADLINIRKSEREEAVATCENEFETFQTNYKKQLELEIKDFEQKRRTEINRLKNIHESKINQEKEVYNRLRDNSKTLFLDICKDFLTNEQLIKRIEEEKNNKFDFASFKAVKNIPSFIDQGYFSCNIFQKQYRHIFSQSTDEIKIQLQQWINEINCITTIDKLVLPNIKRANIGIDYYLATNTKEHVEDIRALVFSILMQYPAGKMNLVMIDPMTSTCFGGLVKLGEDDKSIIDTKVWNTDSDIQSAISRFKDKLNETVNKYGSAIERCLEKENRSLIAIADFPQGFSINALRDLAIILENGSHYGVSFVIAQNDEELEMREQSLEYKKLIDRIKKRMHVYTFEGEYLCYKMMVGTEKVKLYQTFDKTLILRNDKNIINEIYNHLADNVAEVITQVDVHGKVLTDDELLCESSKEGISIPIGLKGIGDQVRLVLGRTNMSDKRHHVLIEGATGAGKGVLLHAIISSALMKYPPQELQIILLDYKEGVEFKTYADFDLPGVRIVSTKSEREFGHNVFKLMVEVLKARAALFKNELPNVSIPNICDYRDKTKKTMPKILFIIDEFETLLGEHQDDIAKDILEDLGRLVKQGRSQGIHIILASQNILLPEDISSQMTVRFALDGSEHVLASDNNGVKLLKPNQAIFNDDAGSKDRNTVFQVMYAAETLRDTLSRISILEQGMDYDFPTKIPKKILYGNIEDHRLHPYNRMIFDDIRPRPLTQKDNDYTVFVGESYDFYEDLLITFSKPADGNLLIVTKDKALSSRIGINITLGLLYSEVANAKNLVESNIVVLDFGVNRSWIYTEENPKTLIANLMSKQMTYIDKDVSAVEEVPFSSMLKEVDKIYDEYLFRKTGNMFASPKFLMIYGLEETKILNKGNWYCDDDIDTSDISATNKLKIIMKEGTSVGIHMIVLFKDFSECCDIYDLGFERMFRHRIAASTDEESMKVLMDEKKEIKMNENTAIYYDESIHNKRLFRVLEIPKTEWLQCFCQKLQNFEKF